MNTNGIGNAKLVGFSSNREAKITLQDAIFDNAALAALTGNDITTAATTVDLIHEANISASITTVTLPAKVKSITTVYLLDTDGVTNKTILTSAVAAAKGSKYSLAGQTLTFAEDTAMTVRIYYKADTDATAKKVKVTSDKFGGTFKLVLDCMVRDEFDKKDYQAQITIPNAKVEDNWKFESAADGDPAVLDIPVEVLKSPTSTDMWYMTIYDEDLIPAS